jgi:flagellar assembly protein FliH
VEKKLSSSSPGSSAQPYTLLEFEDLKRVHKDSAPAEEPLSKEALQERITALRQEARLKGHEEGHAEGFDRGLTEGKNEIRASVKRLEEIILSLVQFRENKLVELFPQIIELSLEIAKKIVHKEIDLDRDLILAVAQDAIQKVGEKEEDVVIKVNPLDYEVMIPHIDLLKEQSGLKNISIEPSAAISPGGCYIETPTGEVDARLEEQMKEVEDVISTAAHRKM